MTNAAYLESIEGACPEDIAWVKENKITSDSQAWRELHRFDWMIWLAKKRGIWDKLEPIKLRLFACDCAEQALPIYEKVYPDDKRPRKAVETARLFAEGKATQEELAAARAAARDAARDAAWDAAWDAARDAARYAAAAAAWDAAWYAARAAARAADWDAAGDAARDAAWTYQAARLRMYFPDPFEESKMTESPGPTPAETELEPCPNPWCSGRAEISRINVHNSYFVRCRDCRLEGPEANNEPDAIAAWNRRPAQPKGGNDED